MNAPFPPSITRIRIRITFHSRLSHTFIIIAR